MNLPPAIIFVNSDPITIRPDGYFVDGYAVNPDGYINDTTLNTFIRQLYLNETMTLKEFNARVAVDPNYPTVVHLQGYRILVIVTDYGDYTNRTLADVVLFYNQGQVTVEQNKFGPPGLSVALQRLNIFDLLRAVGSTFVVILPNTGPPPSGEDEEISETFGGGGIVVEELRAGNPGSLVEDPDEDNNTDFINRR